MANQEIDTIETETLDENFIQEAVLEEARVQEEKRLEEEKKQKNHELWKKQLDNCIQFFNEVAALLDDIYEVVPGRSKQWKSFCLVPKGTANQVTYYGKPVNSLRVAMNWNWRAGLDRCSIPNHIQCVTPDLPYVKPRPKEHPEWSSPPIFGNMVALFDTDHKYHCIFGEKYDKASKIWLWIQNTPKEVADMLRERYNKTHQA